jgi:uncharacterized protein YjbI with pentapeptide repeats
MNLSRRHLLFTVAAASVTAPLSARRPKTKRVSQNELDEAIALHSIWLADPNSGLRCMFAGRDLSGLQFGVLGGEPINLGGADFTQADLSGTQADDLLVHHCSFNGTTFDGCQWRRPVLRLPTCVEHQPNVSDGAVQVREVP